MARIKGEGQPGEGTIVVVGGVNDPGYQREVIRSARRMQKGMGDVSDVFVVETAAKKYVDLVRDLAKTGAFDEM